jgi:outer membrane immunogenic protein
MCAAATLAIFAGAMALGTSASAADLAYKAPPMVVPPFSWTGFYLGGTAGAAWTKADVSMSAVNGPGPLYFPADIPGLNAIGSPNLSSTNAIFGLKGGYNQQWGAWVLGIEGDISSFHSNPSVATAAVRPFSAFGFPNIFGFANFSTNVGTSWLATIRPRVGYAMNNVLFYGTGGAAFANVKYSNSYMALSPLGAGFDFETASASQTQVGWATGAGVDWAVSPHLILSAEYLHVDLGSITAAGGVTTQFNPALTATFNFSTKVTSDLVRVGAAYKF